MHALWLAFIYLSVIYPLVRLRVAGTRCLLFLMFFNVIMIMFYRPLPGYEFFFLVSLYLTFRLLVHQLGRSASSGEMILEYYFRNKRSRPQHPLGHLARLPIELRRQIYHHVLGGELIHIFPPLPNYPPSHKYGIFGEPHGGRETPKLFHLLCNSPDTWVLDHYEGPYAYKTMQDMVDDSMQSSARKRYVKGTGMPLRRPLSCPRSAAIPLLRTSRAVYSEAFDLLYKTNTFEFRRFYSFFRFSQSTTSQDWHSIRSLRIVYRSDGHPINLLRRTDDQGSLRQAVDTIRSMSGLQDLKMRFTHRWKTEYNLDNMLNLSEVLRTEPQLFEQLSRIQLRSGKKCEVILNWPPPLKEETYTSFYISRILGVQFAFT